MYEADVIIVGGGLAGITVACELLETNRKVLLLERGLEPAFGGLAKESFGGVMFVDTPEQRKMGINDSPELALSDWFSFADFEENDVLPKQWAELYTHRSTELVRDWLTQRGIEFLPVVNWAERGLFSPGNSVPRWHIAWGTGSGLTRAILEDPNAHPNRTNLTIKFDHRVTDLMVSAGEIVGCEGTLEADHSTFQARAATVVIASGGICGGNLQKVRSYWYKPWGAPPKRLLNGSHIHADGLLHDVVTRLGGNVTHLDKQWHYAAGIHHPRKAKEMDGLSLVPPRSALWMNARGHRIGPVPLMGYTDTRFLVEQICRQQGQYSWQIMNWNFFLSRKAVM